MFDTRSQDQGDCYDVFDKISRCASRVSAVYSVFRYASVHVFLPGNND